MTEFDKYILSLLSLAWILLSGCSDDRLEAPWSGEYGEGETMVNMEIDFVPFAGVGDDTRSLPGKTMDQINDFCLLAYNKDGELLDGFPKEITDMEITDEPRKDSDSSNGHLAESSTKCGKFSIKLPFGQYYIYGVANLGDRDESGNLTRSTYALLTEPRSELSEAIKTRSGLLNYPVAWDEKNPYNNFEMLGYFCNSKDSKSPSTGVIANDVSVVVNSPNTTLHCWLRRCASKVTIDFDGSELRDNIKVYIKKATIHDIPKHCLLGMPNQPSNRENDLFSYKNSDYSGAYRPDGKGDMIMYSTGDDYKSWEYLSNKRPKITDDSGNSKNFHAENAESMFLYENMQGDSEDERNKEQIPTDGGVVVGSTDEKDRMYCGSYIEVEGYYEHESSYQVEKGKIIYRFMLGKDALKNFDVERNHHIKLTMKFRGNANDVDWHIEYINENGFEFKDPYYVSYLYNHDSTLHFRYVPSKGVTVTKIEAEIVGNNWWPDDENTKYLKEAAKEQNPLTDEELADPLHAKFTHNKYDASSAGDYVQLIGKTKYLGNGFLSLRETDPDLVNILGADLLGSMDNWRNKEENKRMNDLYFYGVKQVRDKNGNLKPAVDRSKRTYTFGSVPDPTNKGREQYSIENYPDGSLRINIPVFTRAKNLVKETAYTGNNPYEGSTRTSYVRVTVHLSNGNTDSQILRVLQVPRLTNPKGIYRKSGNNENFEVRLLDRKSENSVNFTEFDSDGPWMAEVIGDANFINLNGRAAIHGNAGTPIKFSVRFNKMNRDEKIRNAMIRVRYHNYTCVHLIFVRQGYGPLQISEDGASWTATNLIADGLSASDPRDEGSMFKFGNLSDPIDVKSNEPVGPLYQTPEDDYTFKAPGDLYIAATDGSEPTTTNTNTWSGIKGNFEGNDATGYGNQDWKNANIATMPDIVRLYNTNFVSHAYGVLYADGATGVQESVEDAFGYYRHDDPSVRDKKGMRGVFVYFWNPNNPSDQYTAHNMFFPIGRAGYGHRRSWIYNNENQGTQIYSSGRDKMMDISKDKTLWLPLFYDNFRRQGAVYWAKAPMDNTPDAGGSKQTQAALDLNYYTFDVSALPRSNLQKHSQWNGCEDQDCINACFVRLIDGSPTSKNWQ